MLGGTAAALVGYTVSKNPHGAPAHTAVLLRVAIIVTLAAAGLYAQTSELQSRMGQLLAAAGLFSSLWLLNGSGNRLLFSVGMLCSGPAMVMLAYLMLAHPAGRLRARYAGRFLLWIGGTGALAWDVAVFISTQPPVRSPLIRCVPSCPANFFSIGSALTAPGVLRDLVVVLWLALFWGTAVLIMQRCRTVPSPLRRSLGPVCLAAFTIAILLLAFVIGRAAGWHVADAFGDAYLAAVVAVPLAMLLGLGLERLFLAEVLAGFVSELAEHPEQDPERLLAVALGDPSLQIGYWSQASGQYVDSAGAIVPTTATADQAVTRIERERRPVATVIFNQELSDQDTFIQASGAAALIGLEQRRLQGDLAASMKELEASRVRLVETAYTERRRLERDLHDGVQQQLVALRIKLDLAAEAMKHQPVEGERLLLSVGRQMDDVLASLRSLARGIYPSVLHERGLGEALKSAARSSPVAVSVRCLHSARYREEIEIALYFTCLEALQNVAKHAGRRTGAIVTLWENASSLCFEVRDAGAGFDLGATHRGSGVTNMRDRVEAVGGTMSVTSRKGQGTSVRGSVPIA